MEKVNWLSPHLPSLLLCEVMVAVGAGSTWEGFIAPA